tara:strand:+ start:213 stop:983 length:771 start_codon:yes stop_codon:yes gene_type:complete
MYLFWRHFFGTKYINTSDKESQNDTELNTVENSRGLYIKKVLYYCLPDNNFSVVKDDIKPEESVNDIEEDNDEDSIKYDLTSDFCYYIDRLEKNDNSEYIDIDMKEFINFVNSKEEKEISIDGYLEIRYKYNTNKYRIQYTNAIKFPPFKKDSEDNIIKSNKLLTRTLDYAKLVDNNDWYMVTDLIKKYMGPSEDFYSDFMKADIIPLRILNRYFNDIGENAELVLVDNFDTEHRYKIFDNLPIQWNNKFSLVKDV